MEQKKVKLMGSVIIVPESEVDNALDDEIKKLLILCFGWTPEFQERSYWHLKPETRLIYRNNEGVLGHISIISKTTKVGDVEVKIAGAGAFAVHPEFRNSGIGKELVSEMIKHAKQQSYDLIVAFAKDPASIHICLKSGAIPTKDMFLVTYPDGGEVLKPHTIVWPLSEKKYQMLLDLNYPINLGYGSW